MAISAKLVKQLRDATGAGMMDCKKALQACDGDLEEAKLYLQKKGIADSKKRAGRTASEGAVVSWIAPDARSGLLLEVNCETDFVARGADFQEFATGVAELAGTRGVSDVDALLASEWDGQPVRQRLLELTAKTGEKTQLRRLGWVRIADGQLGQVGHYIHTGGGLGTVVGVAVESKADLESDALATLVHDLAMHITASAPLVVSSEALDSALVARQQEIFEAQAAESGKPAHIAEKIATGRLNKWKAEVTLLKQPFVKAPDLKVEKHLVAVAKADLTGAVSVTGFARFKLGEGIEKSESNLAEEVASLTH